MTKTMDPTHKVSSLSRFVLLAAALTSNGFGQALPTPAIPAEPPLATPAPAPAVENVRPVPPRKTSGARIGTLPDQSGDYAPAYAPGYGAPGYGDRYGTSSGGGYGITSSSGYGTISAGRSGSTRETVPPVIVRFTPAEPDAMQQMEEDLSIMTHVLGQALERGLGEETPPSKLGVPLLYTGSGRSVRAMYLEGLGPLFMVKLNIPLIAPAVSSAEKPAQTASDSEWESARREVLGQDRDEEVAVNSTTTPAVPYDADQVEALKQVLTSALKNAANIRQLKEDDYVTVAVFGQPNAQGASGSTSTRATVEVRTNDDVAEAGAKTGNAAPQPAKPAKKGSGSRSTGGAANVNRKNNTYNILVANSPAHKGSVLTMRVKSSDISAFAKDKLQLEEFRRKIVMNAYSGNGNGVTSVNSWMQTGGSAVRF